MNSNLIEIAIDAIENLLHYDYHGKPLNDEDEAGMHAISALREELSLTKTSSVIDKIKNLDVASGSDMYNDGYRKAIEDVLGLILAK